MQILVVLEDRSLAVISQDEVDEDLLSECSDGMLELIRFVDGAFQAFNPEAGEYEEIQRPEWT